MTDKPFQETEHANSAYLRPNQAWICGDKDASCTQGPTAKGLCWRADNPCVPLRSVRAKKRLMAFWIVAVSMAALFITLSSENILSILSPGPLSVNHAQVADCKACHTAAGEDMSGWLHKALRLGGKDDSKQCLTCHELGKHAFTAHSTSKVNLTKNLPQTTNNLTTNWKASLASTFHGLTSPDSKGISCSNCHREHQGQGHSLKAFDTDKCHTCHQLKFDEIQLSHPEYTRYPHDTPTRIRFDHVTHLEDYFYQDEYFDIAPSGCKQCHDTDQTGEWMLSENFETACSDCHLDQILGQRRASAKGVAVLSIPELDVESIEQAGFFIGEWPRADGELVPIMRLLLSASSQAPLSIAKDTELYDLTQSKPDELEKVAQLAWDIKELFFDIQSGGTALLNERLSSAFDGRLDQAMLSRLIASLPRDTLISNQQDWFPNLQQEINDYRKGVYHAQSEGSQIETGLGATAIESQAPEQTQAGGSAQSDDLLSDELLLDDEDDGGLFDEQEPGELFDDFAEDEEEAVVADIDINAIAAEDWAQSGGWYREGSSIRYRPSAHADPFLKSWLEASSTREGALTADIYAALNQKDSVGNCMKCHRTNLVNTHASGDIVVLQRWQSFKPADNKSDFNRFSHVSHFSLMTDDGCSSCHLLNLDGQQALSGETPDDTDFETHFLSMNRDTCTQCHQEGRAPSGCLTCHRYHVDNQSRSIDWISDELQHNREPEL